MIDPNQRYLLHPDLQCLFIGNDRVELSLPLGTHKLRAASSVWATLQKFRDSSPCSAKAVEGGVGKVMFDALVKYLFLLPDHEADILVGGLCTSVNQPAGRTISPYQLDQLTHDDVVVLHVPILTTMGCGVSVAAGGQWVRRQLTQILAAPSVNAK